MSQIEVSQSAIGLLPGRTIAIVGAGFSGTLMALHLLRQAQPNDRIVLIERAHALGRGTAYSTTNLNHLLNVRAGNMSALADQPLDFVDWLRERGPGGGEFGPASFVPRSVYGSYVSDRLETAIQDSPAELERVRADIRGVNTSSDGFVLETECGGRIRAHQLVLATGNAPPEPPRAGPAFLASWTYRADPWAPDALAGLPQDAPVLLLGTGLTMVDTVISLLDQGHRGPIHALSRRGQIPRRHVAMPIVPANASQAIPGTFLGLMRQLRSDAAACEAAELPWQLSVDRLRPHTQAIWAAASPEDRARFLRHVRPWWDVHRHRVAPQVADRIDNARARGQLQIHVGRIAEFSLAGSGAAISYTPRRQTGSQQIQASRVINCTGPGCDYARSQDPLFRSLLNAGAARPDHDRLGLDVTLSSEVIGRTGAVTPNLFAVGPLTRGLFWEVTAVPDIRHQCAAVAAHVLAAPVSATTGLADTALSGLDRGIVMGVAGQP